MVKRLFKYRLMNRTILILFILWALSYSISYLGKKYLEIPGPVLSSVNAIVTIIITFLVVSIIIRLSAPRLFRFLEGEVEIEHQIFATKMYSIAWYLLGFAFLLYKLGAGLSNVTIFLGLATTGIAFAIRDVLMSFFAWLIVLSKRPFRIGDYVTIDGEKGKVSRIGTFFMTLEDESSGDLLKIPNKMFLEKSLRNFGKNEPIDTIRLNIIRLPSQKSLEKIIQRAKRLSSDESRVKGFIDAKEDNYQLVIKYPVDPSSRENVRSDLITEIFEAKLTKTSTR